MTLSREEKEKRVLELYYDKGYTYREIAKELRMSPNQIREIIKRHEEKNDAIAKKKKMLSLSSHAYKLFSKGKTNVQVAIKMDLPQEQITQFRTEYWRLQNQDKLESFSWGTFVAQQIANGSTQSCHDLPKQIAKSRA
jgi:predicted DNA-binding protein YlxM (UPF0122 family)